MENIVTKIVSTSGKTGIIGTSPEYVKDLDGKNAYQIFASKEDILSLLSNIATNFNAAKWNNTSDVVANLNIADINRAVEQARKVNFNFELTEPKFTNSVAASLKLTDLDNLLYLVGSCLTPSALTPYLKKEDAKELYLRLGNYLTEHQSLEGYAKLTDLNALARLETLANYYKKSEINEKLDAKLDALRSGIEIKTINGTSILGDGNISINVPDIENSLNSDRADRTLSAALGKILALQVASCAKKSEISDMLTKTEASKTYLTSHLSLDNYATKFLVAGMLSKDEAITKYQPKGEYLTEHQSLDNYMTKDAILQNLSLKLDTLVSTQNIKTINGYSILGLGNLLINIPEKVEIVDATNSTEHTKALSAYQGKVLNDKLNLCVLSSQIEDMLTKTEANSTYLTLHQSLDEYAKKTEIPSVEGFATKEELNVFAKNEDIEDMAKISDIPTDINQLLDSEGKLDLIKNESFYQEYIYVPYLGIELLDKLIIGTKSTRGIICTPKVNWHLYPGFESDPAGFSSKYNLIYIPKEVSQIKIILTAGYFIINVHIVNREGFDLVPLINLLGGLTSSLTVDLSSILEDTWLAVEVLFKTNDPTFTNAFISNASIQKTGFALEYEGYPDNLLAQKLVLFQSSENKIKGYAELDETYSYTELLYITSNYLHKNEVGTLLTDAITDYFNNNNIDTSLYITGSQLTQALANFITANDMRLYTGTYYLPKGEYLTEIPSEYITESELNAKNYLTEHQDISGKSDKNHKHSKEDVLDFPTSMPASDVYSWAKQINKPSYTYSEVGAAKANHNHSTSDISNFPTSLPASDVHLWAKAANKPIYEYSEIQNTPTQLPASDVYSWAKADTKPTYTYTEVGAAPAVHTHSLYAIDSEMTEKLALKLNVISDLETIRSKATTALQEHQSLDAYYTKTETDAKYLTEHQSLSGLASESWVEGKNYLVASSLTGYATENWVEAKKYLTAHLSLDNYYSKEETYSRAESDEKYLTEHLSLNNYYTKEEADGKYLSSNYAPFIVVSELPETPATGNVAKIHLVANANGQTGNVFNEYVYTGTAWELLGEFKPNIDLTPYLTKESAESTYSKIIPTIDKGSVASITITSEDDNKVIKFTANTYFTVNSTGLSWIGDKLCMSGKSYMLIILDGVAALNVLN